jgi:hypothetical protein
MIGAMNALVYGLWNFNKKNDNQNI